MKLIIKKLKKHYDYLIKLLLLSIWLVICITPILILFMASISDTAIFQTIPDLFSLEGTTLVNYRISINQGNFFFHLRNSLIIAGSALALVLVVCTPMAYGITKLSSRKAKSAVVFGVLSTRFIPYVVIAMPLYLLFRQMGLSGSLPGVIMAHLAMQMPFIVWLMVGFFDGIPGEVEEAAIIDGCTPFQIFFKVSLPMVLPGLNAAAILAFIMSYNEFLFGLFLAGPNTRPLTVGIMRFVGGVEVGAQYGVVAAYGSMIVVPIIIFALIVNRYIVSGMTQGAVKE